MTKLEELAQIEAQLLLLRRDASREHEIMEACAARLATILDKHAKLAQRLDAVANSKWE